VTVVLTYVPFRSTVIGVKIGTLPVRCHTVISQVQVPGILFSFRVGVRVRIRIRVRSSNKVGTKDDNRDCR
jgi:hypothetical protein